jgi:probable F420-dependent oxidoreductase
VKFGLILSQLARLDVPAPEWIPFACHCEELGYQSVWVNDRLAVPAPGAGDEGPAYEALTMVSALAAGTQRVHIGTCVLVLPLRHPAVTAKMLATADLIANGRIVLGLGSGRVRAEFDALGLPSSHFEQRAGVTDEYLLAIKEMWLSTGPSNFTGRHVSFADVGTFPKPRQQPHPRIVVAGDGARVLRRASRHGGGYLCASLSPAELAERVGQLRGICRRDRRDPDEVEVHMLARPPRALAPARWSPGDLRVGHCGPGPPGRRDPARILRPKLEAGAAGGIWYRGRQLRRVRQARRRGGDHRGGPLRRTGRL